MHKTTAEEIESKEATHDSLMQKGESNSSLSDGLFNESGYL